MEHPLREHVRTRLGAVFGEGPGVRNAEKSVYNWAVKWTREHGDTASWENVKFRKWYKFKAHQLFQELEHGEMIEVRLEVRGGCVNLETKIVPQLVWRLRHKELEMRKLGQYSPEAIWPEGPRAQAFMKHKAKELALEKAKASEEDYEGLFKCGRCKSTKTTYYQLQTRSADEPMVRFLVIVALCLRTPTDAPSSDRLRTSPARTVDTSGSAKFFCRVIVPNTYGSRSSRRPQGSHQVPELQASCDLHDCRG